MTDTLKIKVKISSTNPDIPLGLEVWADNTCVTDIAHVTESVTECEIADAECKHTLRIVLKNKLPEHTQIDTNGNIVQDAMLTVDLIEFDEINIKDLFVNRAEYTHSFNGSAATVVDRCHGNLGCNGTVSLEFESPFYLWLLENM